MYACSGANLCGKRVEGSTIDKTMTNDMQLWRQGAARFELISTLVIRAAEFSHELDDELSNYRYRLARIFAWRRTLAVYATLGTGVVAFLVGYLLSVLTGKAIGGSTFTEYAILFGMIAISLGIIALMYVAAVPAELPQRYRGAGLKRAFVIQKGGVGAISGLLFYHEDDHFANLLQRHLDAASLTKDDDELIKTLLVEGSELTVDQLIATARSLR